MKFYASLLLTSTVAAFAPQQQTGTTTQLNVYRTLETRPWGERSYRFGREYPEYGYYDRQLNTSRSSPFGYGRGRDYNDRRSYGMSRYNDRRSRRNYSDVTSQEVQGQSLKTWSYGSSAVDMVQIMLSTEGRPLDADVELWQGPDNTPVKMRVYVEDGSKRPFNAIIETPRGPNTIAVRNIGQVEFPILASVTPDAPDRGMAIQLATTPARRTVQGGALMTFPFEPDVESIAVALRTDGRPLNARVELLQGPNNNKQVIELYTEDGLDRPFFAVIETPGSGNVIRIVNSGPVEYPLTASVEAYDVDPSAGRDAVLGGTRDF
uniref:Uncharacterized protein n=1 Tax=Leptocylindrus danicus TaxID=163516 RepID=A0A7S2K3X0_9STRA|mmetsp:Transcript_17225/g.25624  ORF Transcript_17225/g.25624 Transcript_17225/m.25624 type:complete len:321 (+) Transcript_17225:103-1065(+)|eukprot:CAMPEP_0116024654 /NCGR_PEP_ID=MMETSP0321-20121206/12465_1 /TAXON_ID=163516 /ORGANISM="Leptocylindrus danicus var. danicus, Strain B650" /LENGTH=320 /DNA_ID=CAMNT_0003496465 /DNA_START=89 /DNA_END=1051 /DNA_ORIENTATION=-